MVSIFGKYTVPVLGDRERLVLGGCRVAPRLKFGKVVLDDANEAVQIAHREPILWQVRVPLDAP